MSIDGCTVLFLSLAIPAGLFALGFLGKCLLEDYLDNRRYEEKRRAKIQNPPVRPRKQIRAELKKLAPTLVTAACIFLLASATIWGIASIDKIVPCGQSADIAIIPTEDECCGGVATLQVFGD